MRIKVLFFILLAIIWLGLTGFRAEWLLILCLFVVPLLTLLSTIRLSVIPTKNAFKVNAILYFFWLLKEIILSTIAVIKIAWRKNLRILPILEPIKSTQKKEIGVIIYANSITLTPGTVTLSMEDNLLLVHALDIKFMDDLYEGKMDNKIKEIIK